MTLWRELWKTSCLEYGQSGEEKASILGNLNQKGRKTMICSIYCTHLYNFVFPRKKDRHTRMHSQQILITYTLNFCHSQEAPQWVWGVSSMSWLFPQGEPHLLCNLYVGFIDYSSTPWGLFYFIWFSSDIFTFEPNPLNKFYSAYKNIHKYKFIYVLYNIYFIYYENILISQATSAFQHALNTVGAQYMFAELNWRETDKMSRKRKGLSSRADLAVELLDSTQCRQS